MKISVGGVIGGGSSPACGEVGVSTGILVHINTIINVDIGTGGVYTMSGIESVTSGLSGIFDE